MHFLRDGYYFFAAFAIVSAAAYAYSAYASFAALAFGAFCLWFFRDPYRAILHNDGTVLSACDGKVLFVRDVFEPKFLKCRALQIATFLSPLNVHINRAPVAGVIRRQHKVNGGFAPAFMKSSENNARNYIHIRGKKSDVLVVPSVGILARRIVSWVREGERVHQGHKIGMIRFGSRTDVFVPIHRVRQVFVKKGDRVFAGKTALMHLHD